jgi:hypothetical protein
MDDHRLFCGIIDDVCRVAAGAITRYAEVSGVNPVRTFVLGDPSKPRGSMDEHFLPSFVFDHLGRVGQVKGLRMRLWPTLESLQGPRLDNRKPDLVIFHPDHEDQVLALVEFKPHCAQLESARKELLTRMGAVACPFGAVCAMHADTRAAYLPTLKDKAKVAGDTWHSREATLPSSIGDPEYSNYFAVARGFQTGINDAAGERWSR